MSGRVKGPDTAKMISGIATRVERAGPQTVKAALADAKKLHEREIRRDTGGDMRLTGANRAKGRPGNARVGVRTNTKGLGARTTGFIGATGPLQLVNNDTAGHVITSAYLRGAGRRARAGRSQVAGPGLVGTLLKGDRRAVLRIPGVPGFRSSARHPGTKGKNTWQRGAVASRPVIRKQMRQKTFDSVRAGAKGLM